MSSSLSYGTALSELDGLEAGIGAGGLTAAQTASLTALLSTAASADGTGSYVYGLLHEITAATATGTSQAGFNALINQWFLGTDDPTPLAGDRMVSDAGATLFPTDLSSAYSLLDQGANNGDCWLVAALVETAHQDPSALQSMLWENPNGTYGVRFCSPTGYEYLTVNADVMSGDGVTSQDGTIWAPLLEKAFVEAQADGLSFPMSGASFFTTTYPDNYSVVAGGGWDEMMAAITGRQTDDYTLRSQAALSPGGSIFTILNTDLQTGLDVMLASYSDTSYGMVDDHMFAVIGIDTTNNDYILFNPWGTTETAQARFEVSAAQLASLARYGDEFLAADGSAYFTEATLCHLAGTRILTPAGERPIEALRIGDLVATRFRGFQPIRWIGEQHYAARFAARNRLLAPIRIAPDALGPGLPRRELCISPGHSLLLNNILVLARDLVNGVNITQPAAPAEIHYYNLELDQHDCVLAEGTWSETYADCADLRASFHNARTYPRRGPAPAAPCLCVPRPGAGPAFTAALARPHAMAVAQTRLGALCGYIERLGPEITGWAADALHPDLPVRLVLCDGAQPLATVFALAPRADVLAAGFGNGRGGFTLPLPPGADPARLCLRRAETGEVLPLVHAPQALVA